MPAAFRPAVDDAGDSRRWPVDDDAMGVDDRGRPLPFNLLSDLQVAWTDPLGTPAWVSAWTLTPAQAMVVVSSPAGALGWASVPRSRAWVHRAVPLSPLREGAAGWVVFGSGIMPGAAYADVDSWRCSAPAQALLLSACARPFPGSVLRSLSKVGAPPLAGVVELAAEAPLAWRAATHVVDGVPTACLELAADAPRPGSRVGAASTLAELAGPCAAAPETRSCPDPQPIETIAGVGPDCDGFVTLEWAGCAEPGRRADGVPTLVLSCDLPASSACAPPHLPELDGRLPYETDVPVVPLPPAETPVDPPVDPLPEPVAFPQAACFQCLHPPAGWSFAGAWETRFGDDGLGGCVETQGTPCPPSGATGALAATDAGALAWASWDFGDAGVLGRWARASVRLRDSGAASPLRAGLAANWRDDGGVPTWWAWLADYRAQAFVLGRWDGSTFGIAASVPAPGLRLDEWFELEWSAVADGNRVRLTATAKRGGVLAASAGPLLSRSFAPGSGRWGLVADRTVAEFGRLEVDLA